MDASTISDEDLLIEYAHTGEERLFNELGQRLRPRMLFWARRVTRDDSAADDVVQEVLVKLQAIAGTYSGRASVRTWLFAIVRNRAIQWRRRRRGLPLSPWAAAPALHQPVTGLVYSLVAALPPIYRDVVVLTDLWELPYVEAARRLGVPVGTIRSRRHQALARLRAMPLKDFCDDSEPVLPLSLSPHV